ncbi:MAG TPA: hypothetical protein QF900_06355, partial [Arenicellales bacterium]|nr:hypothetical protein [Arenicellales bacterium]
LLYGFFYSPLGRRVALLQRTTLGIHGAVFTVWFARAFKLVLGSAPIIQSTAQAPCVSHSLPELLFGLKWGLL